MVFIEYRIREVVLIVFAQIHHRLTEVVIKTGTGGLGKSLLDDELKSGKQAGMLCDSEKDQQNSTPQNESEKKQSHQVSFFPPMCALPMTTIG